MPKPRARRQAAHEAATECEPSCDEHTNEDDSVRPSEAEAETERPGGGVRGKQVDRLTCGATTVTFVLVVGIIFWNLYSVFSFTYGFMNTLHYQ
jgi:hypothetical protein